GNAFAQFVHGRQIANNAYGMFNAVYMAANLAYPETGRHDNGDICLYIAAKAWPPLDVICHRRELELSRFALCLFHRYAICKQQYANLSRLEAPHSLSIRTANHIRRAGRNLLN